MVASAFGYESNSISINTVANVGQSGSGLPTYIYMSGSLNSHTSGVLIGSSSIGTLYNTYKL